MNQEIKQFIKNTITFSLILALAIILLNQVYILKINPDKIIYRKESEWQEYKQKLANNTLNYAIIGDSHAINDLIPSYLQKSYNFGIGGEDYTETYYKVRKLLETDKVKINNLVIEIDAHTFSEKIRTPDNLFKEMRFFTPFVPFNDIIKLKKKGYISAYLETKLPILGKGNELIIYLLSGQEITLLNSGWVNLTSDFNLEDKEKLASDAFNLQFNESPRLLNELSISYFIEILKIAEKDKINIIFIKYPVSREYDNILTLHNVSKEYYYQEMFSRINKVTEDYIVIDYSAIFFDHPEYFSNADHLNWKGAEILSEKVREDIKNKSRGNLGMKIPKQNPNRQMLAS